MCCSLINSLIYNGTVSAGTTIFYSTIACCGLGYYFVASKKSGLEKLFYFCKN
jgi:hypothetical protein